MTTTTAPRVPGSRGATPVQLRPTARRACAEAWLLLLADVVAVASLALAVAVSTQHAGGIPPALRAAVAVLAATILPGVPLVVLLRPASRGVGTALATSSSWAVTIIVAQITLVARWWHPMRATAAIDVASLALCVVAHVTVSRREGRVLALGADLRLAARWVGHRAVPLAALVVAVALFVLQARSVDVDHLGPFGLITAIRWPFLAALVLVAVVWVRAAAARRLDHGLLALAFTVLTLVITSLVSAAEGRTSVPTGFVHRGFIDMIRTLHHLPPPIDARIDWAGFFAGSAQLVAAAGLHDATPLMSPSPVLAGALLIAPLFVIGRAVTGSAHVAWIGVLLYQLTNWYQQDYFAPQMVAQLWFTTIIAVMLWWWRAARTRQPRVAGVRQRVLRALRRTPPVPAGLGAGRVLATEGLLVLLGGTMVVTHQLTPMALVAVLLAFTLTGSTRFRSLWLTTAIIFVVWFSFGAKDYWLGNLTAVLNDLGQVGGSVSGGVGDRIGQLPSRQLGQYVRIASSGALGAVGLAGWLLRARRPGWLLIGALAAIPFGLVAVQSYGGEVVIRCFLLASPILAPLAASALVRAVTVTRVVVGGRLGLVPDAVKRHFTLRRRPGVLGVTVLTLVVALGGVFLTLTRGLNASFERTTRSQDVIGLSLLDAVPDKTQIVPVGDAPWLDDERTLSQVTVGFTQADGADCTSEVLTCLERVDPQYVVITPEMEAQGLYMYGQRAGWTTRIERRLVSRDGYVVAHRDPEITVLRRSDVTVPAGAL